MSTFLDTNCLLRYLLADIKDQFETVCRHVENGACTSPEFVAECVYALGGTVYGFDRTDVANTMTALLDDIACEHEAAGRYALELYRNHTPEQKAQPIAGGTRVALSAPAPLRGELFPLAYTRAVALAGAQAMAHNTECFVKSRGLRKPVRYGNSVAVRIRHVGHAYLRRRGNGARRPHWRAV